MNQIITDAINTNKALTADFEKNCTDALIEAVDLIVKKLKQGGTVYIAGNGGSAADAQHITGELVGRFLKERKALPAIALTTDSSVMTSVANDYDYSSIFKRQVEGLVRENDLFWALSTSGTSGNIIEAAKLAKQNGASILAFTGKLNTPLQALADVTIAVDAPNTASAQEVHQLAYHIICQLVEDAYCTEPW
jgi:D-sedoheptulose 7-phosphate isomerase